MGWVVRGSGTLRPCLLLCGPASLIFCALRPDFAALRLCALDDRGGVGIEMPTAPGLSAMLIALVKFTTRTINFGYVPAMFADVPRTLLAALVATSLAAVPVGVPTLDGNNLRRVPSRHSLSHLFTAAHF